MGTGLTPKLLEKMLPDKEHTVMQIEYRQFKRDNKAGRGIKSVTTKKDLNQSRWRGAHYQRGASVASVASAANDALWIPFGSAEIPAEDNKRYFQELIAKPTKGGWNYKL